MADILIYRDDRGIADFRSRNEKIKDQLNATYQQLLTWDVFTWSFDDLGTILASCLQVERIDSIYGANVGFTPLQANFEGLTKIICDYLKSKAVDNANPSQVLGLDLNRSKLLEMVEVPEPPTELLNVVDQACHEIKMQNRGQLNLSFFALSGSDIIINNDATTQWEDDHYYFWATTTAEIAMTEEILNLCTALNAFIDYMKAKSLSYANGLDRITYQHPALTIIDGVYYPKYEFIKRHAK